MLDGVEGAEREVADHLTPKWGESTVCEFCGGRAVWIAALKSSDLRLDGPPRDYYRCTESRCGMTTILKQEGGRDGV